MAQSAPGSLLLSQLGIQRWGCSVSVENAFRLVKLLYRIAESMLLPCINAKVEIILTEEPVSCAIKRVSAMNFQNAMPTTS